MLPAFSAFPTICLYTPIYTLVFYIKPVVPMGPVVCVGKGCIFCSSAKKNKAPFHQLLSLEGTDMSSAFDKLWKGKAIDKLPKRKLEAER